MKVETRISIIQSVAFTSYLAITGSVWIGIGLGWINRQVGWGLIIGIVVTEGATIGMVLIPLHIRRKQAEKWRI